MYEKIINMTFSSVFEKKMILIRALIVYTIAMMVIDYININNVVIIEGRQHIENKFLSFATFLFSYLVLLMVAISTHRILILGEQSIPKWGYFNFSKRERSFIGKGMVMGLIVMAIVIPVILLGSPLGKLGFAIAVIIFFFVSTILISRFSLVFPAIAVDKDITLSEAWNFTKRYKLLVFITVILFPLLFSLIFGFIYGIAIAFLAGLFNLNLFFLNSVLNIFIMVFTIAALSATYRLISKEHPEYFEPKKPEEIVLRETVVQSEDDVHKIIIHDKNDITFEELKNKLNEQYSQLGFTNVAVDKESFWMIKNPLLDNSYILLSHLNDEYVIEVYKCEMINFIDKINLEN